MQQFFNQKWIELRNGANYLYRFFRGPLYKPTSVHEEIELVAKRFSRGSNELDVLIAVFSENTPSKFDCRETLINVSLNCLGHRLRRWPKECARVRAHFAPPLAAEQDVNWLSV